MSEFLDRMANLSEKRRALLALRFQKAGIETQVIPRRPLDGTPPAVSFAQQRLWFLEEYAPGNAAYNIPYSMRLEGRLEVAVLEKVFTAILERHEVLRTTFDTLDDAPVQVIAPPARASLGLVDLRTLPREQRERHMLELVSAEARRAFDLRQGSLIRLGLLRMAREDHVLLLTQHHIVSDGWSVGVLARELSTLYAAFAEGQPSPLPELPIQYADFSLWQREWLRGKVLQDQLTYWKDKLGGDLAVLELPTDRPRPPAQTFRGNDTERRMPVELIAALKKLSRSHGSTLFMTVLAAYMVVLHRHSGQTDIVVGSAIAGRNRAELEAMIGFFVNMLVLRTDLTGDPTFHELLEQVKETTLGAYANQDLPFEQLVNTLRPERDSSRPPLFQVVLTLQNTPGEPPSLPGLAMSPLEYEIGTSRFDLTVNMAEKEDCFLAAVEYNIDLFDQTTVLRLMLHYQQVLQAVVDHPESRISELPLLSTEESAQILAAWNDSKRTAELLGLADLFEAQVARTPEAVAVSYEERRLRYRELDQEASRLGHHLLALGVGPDQLVGLCVERSPEMIVGILGILKAGAAYLPFDPSYPRVRLADMLSDAGVGIVVSQEALLDGLLVALSEVAPAGDAPSPEVVCLDRDRESIVACPSTHPPRAVLPGNLAYTLYTSGSTGRPKGVMIEQGAVANFAESVIRDFEIGPRDTVLQFASICFDVSVFDIFSALLSGATLSLGRREELIAPETLMDLMERESVSVADIPPALLALMDPTRLRDLRLLFVGLEKLSAELVDRWASPGTRRFINGYGPTEATVAVIWKECEPGRQAAPPIGVPMPNHQMYMLDPYGAVVPIGTPGELHVGGSGLARGYFRRPALTAEKFVPDPFGALPGSRLYRTGDLSRYLADGDADFLSRLDDQVKIRGLRIELGEIEQVLREHPCIDQVVVMAREDQPGRKLLAAYAVQTEDRWEGKTAPPTSRSLREYLGDRLPAYMVPAAFVFLDEVPTSPSGKVNHKLLPVPEISRDDLGEKFVEPRSSTERLLAGEAFLPVLGIKSIGVHDNFFELGGSSLQATQLVARIRRACGVRVPLATLFSSPTIAALAKVIDGAGGTAGEDGVGLPLVALQPRGDRPPFYCVHAISGTVFSYRDLARLLGEEQPFYGFQAPGLESGETPLEASIDDIAAHYLEALRRHRPAGPYLLGGWSMGGTVAYEMARRLRDEGEDVALLALLDVEVPEEGIPLPDDAELARMLMLDMAGLLSHRIDLPPVAELRGLSSAQRVVRLMEVGRTSGLLPPDFERDELRRRLEVFQRHVPAMWSYPPRSYDGRITLFRATESPANNRGWQRLASGGVDHRVVPGDHYTMLRQPHLQILATSLREALRAAVETAPHP